MNGTEAIEALSKAFGGEPETLPGGGARFVFSDGMALDVSERPDRLVLQSDLLALPEDPEAAEALCRTALQINLARASEQAASVHLDEEENRLRLAQEIAGEGLFVQDLLKLAETFLCTWELLHGRLTDAPAAPSRSPFSFVRP